MLTEMTPLSIALKNGNRILGGRHTLISFVRTLRIPEDGTKYPLPAGLGRLPIYRVADYAKRVPQSWLETGGFFIPLYQREALFLEFSGAEWRPTIAKVAVGSINAVSGKPYDTQLRSHQQDYLVIPNQEWLDGINLEKGAVGQFVAMPLGMGYTIEEQITDDAKHGGFQIVLFDPKPEKFPEENPEFINHRSNGYWDRHPSKGYRDVAFAQASQFNQSTILCAAQKSSRDIEMGIAAGGSIQQQIIADPHGVDFWDAATATPIHIHIVNSVAFEAITGEKVPPTPITAYSYKKRGIPWYSKYDENSPTVAAAKAFRVIKRVFQIDRSRGDTSGKSSTPIKIDSAVMKRIHVPTLEEHIDELRQRADTTFRACEYEATVRATTSVMDFVTNDQRMLLLRAHAYLRLGHHKQAEMDASSALDLEPRNVQALLIRGHANLSSGWHELARDDANVALLISPNEHAARKLLESAESLHLESLRKQAAESFHRHEYELVVRETTSLLDLHPNDVSALVLRAHACLRLKRHRQAKEDATSVLNVEPENIRALIIRGYAQLSLGSSIDAASDAMEVLKIAPDDTNGLILLETVNSNQSRE